MFWNKYPQTNFHELNADWIISKINELTSTVEEYTEVVNAMDSRVSALESGQTALSTRVSTAESNIGQMMDDMEQMNTRILSHAGEILALQNAAIQDARMIRSIDLPDRDAESAGFNYTVDQYTDGVKSTETEQFTMWGATESLAGCLEAADKVKLNKMTASGNDITFAGKVKSSSAPAAGSDLTNKTYVDSLAIAGAVPDNLTKSELDASWTASQGTLGSNDARARRYGYLMQLTAGATITLTGSGTIGKGDELARLAIGESDYLPASWISYFGAWPCVINPDPQGQGESAPAIIASDVSDFVVKYAGDPITYSNGLTLEIWVNIMYLMG